MIAQVPITVSLPISTVVVPQEATLVIVPMEHHLNQRDRTGGRQRPARAPFGKSRHRIQTLRLARVSPPCCNPAMRLYADSDGKRPANRIDKLHLGRHRGGEDGKHYGFDARCEGHTLSRVLKNLDRTRFSSFYRSGL